MKVLMLSALWAAGCTGEEDDSTPTETDLFGQFVNVTDTPAGDLTCFSGEWLESSFDPACQGIATLEGTSEDFETGDPVANATVELFYSDDVTTSPDQTYTTDTNGELVGEVATCTPVSYRVTTDPGLDQTKVTIEAHSVYDAGKVVDTEFNSVSTVTYRLIPSLLGVTVDADKGVVAGTVYDCNGDPVEFSQVVVTDANGDIPDSLVVKYFVDEFPNRDQPTTSDDGLWVAINVPEGDWNIEAWVSDGAGGHTLVGATQLTVYADGINISNIYTGYEDGVVYPESCSSCG